MSCVRAILPKLGFGMSFVCFSYLFLDRYVYYPECLLLGIILTLTSSFLVFTFVAIQYLDCRYNKSLPKPQQSSETCEEDKQCFMKLWNAGKDWHWLAKGLYYGTLMPVVFFLLCGLFLGILIYFASGILMFYLIIKHCMARKERKQAGNPKYESDSELDVSGDKK